MKVWLSFVPPGGGEQDYGMEAELPALPRPGDYVMIVRKSTGGSEDFIVRRTLWSLAAVGSDEPLASVTATVERVTVECEFALGLMSSGEHKKACERYRTQGHPLKEFETSAY